jgi:hypothetical protein
MADNTTPVPYTQGVFKLGRNDKLNPTRSHGIVVDWEDGDEHGTSVVAEICETSPSGKDEGDGRLFVASRNSYAKHCGPNAIQCAEDDLLGQALDALRRAVNILDAESEACGMYTAHREIIDNVLSRLPQ